MFCNSLQQACTVENTLKYIMSSQQYNLGNHMAALKIRRHTLGPVTSGVVLCSQQPCDWPISKLEIKESRTIKLSWDTREGFLLDQ